MSDVSKAFAPVRAKLYTAPLGTSVSGITATSTLSNTFEDNGAIDLDAGFSFSPAGSPSRTVEREFYDDKVFYVTKSPSDDLPTFDITFKESNIQVVENAFGVTVASDGSFSYTGGIPTNKCMVLDLADAAASPKTMRYLIPNAGVSINGSIAAAGSTKLMKWPLSFTAEPSADISDALFKSWASWLADLS